MPKQWHTMRTQEILDYFQTDKDAGLSAKEAKGRLSKYGNNRIERRFITILFSLLNRQVKNSAAAALFTVAVFSVVYLSYVSLLAMLLLITVVIVTGGLLEYCAARILMRIRKKSTPLVKVIREGHTDTVPACALAPGDIVLLAPGDLVPADLRLLHTDGLVIEESFTGQGAAQVAKSAEEVPSAVPGGGQIPRNMACTQTVVIRGQGKGLVVQPARGAGVGRRQSTAAFEGVERTPLRISLRKLAGRLSAVSCAACVATLVVFFLYGIDRIDLCLAGLSIAVALIPVGIPWIYALMTVFGAKSMEKQGVLFNSAAAMEKIGCATTLCLNKASMSAGEPVTAIKIVTGGKIHEVTGTGYDPKGEICGVGKQRHIACNLLVKAAALCNNAVLRRGNIDIPGIFRRIRGVGVNRSWSVTGSAVEGALLVLAAKAGVWREMIESKEQRVTEIPFSPERRLMTVIYKDSAGKLTAYVKGASEFLLGCCSYRYVDGKQVVLTERDKIDVLQYNKQLANEALQVLALACRQVPECTTDFTAEAMEKQLTFLGLVGLQEPVQSSLKETVDVCRQAGINLLPVTGDQAETMLAQVQRLGVNAEDGRILTGSHIESMTERELQRTLKHVSLCAQATPQNKLRVLRALKQTGQVVAVTGCDHDDAENMRASDISIATHDKGTDSIKKDADILLAGGRINGIVAAVATGRNMRYGIRCALQLLLSSSVALVCLTAAALLCGMPLPLSPVQVLWINLLVCLPAMAAGAAADRRMLLFRPPEQLYGNIIDVKMAWRILTGGAVSFCGAAVAYATSFALSDTLAAAGAMSFNTLVFTQLFYALRDGVLFDRRLIGAVALASVLQFAINLYEPIAACFNLVSLTGTHWTIILIIAAAPASFARLANWLYGKIEKRITYLKVRPN